MSAFELVTGYMVIASAELVTTYAINPAGRLLEVPPNLTDSLLVKVLVEAQERIGHGAARHVLAPKLAGKLSTNTDLGTV